MADGWMSPASGAMSLEVACATCTFLNASNAARCALCRAVLPRSRIAATDDATTPPLTLVTAGVKSEEKPTEEKKARAKQVLSKGAAARRVRRPPMAPTVEGAGRCAVCRLGRGKCRHPGEPNHLQGCVVQDSDVPTAPLKLVSEVTTLVRVEGGATPRVALMLSVAAMPEEAGAATLEGGKAIGSGKAAIVAGSKRATAADTDGGGANECLPKKKKISPNLEQYTPRPIRWVKDQEVTRVKDQEVSAEEAHQLATAEGLTLIPSHKQKSGWLNVVPRKGCQGSRLPYEARLFQKSVLVYLGQYATAEGAALAVARHYGPAQVRGSSSCPSPLLLSFSSLAPPLVLHSCLPPPYSRRRC